MPLYDYAILAAGWVAWFAPFLLNRWSFGGAQLTDHRARWGMLLQAIGYAILWQGRFWTRAPGSVRLALAVLFLVLAALLSWTATRALGRFLRFDAALTSDHKLVRSGPYRVVRHPIYSSMLAIFLGMGCMVASPILFIIGAIVFLAGTEIRVQVEDRLLASRFGDPFVEYRRSVAAYVPLLR